MKLNIIVITFVDLQEVEDILSGESSSSSDDDDFKTSQNVSSDSSDDSMTGEFPRGHKRKRADMEVRRLNIGGLRCRDRGLAFTFAKRWVAD